MTAHGQLSRARKNALADINLTHVWAYDECMPIDNSDLDRYQQAYKNATEQWVAAIREEEALATPDHSIRAWERWEQAGFKAKEAQEKATLAKEAYKAGLRLRDYSM